MFRKKKGIELRIEQAKQALEDAHQKKLEAIDKAAKGARATENATYDKKMRALDKVAERVRFAAHQVSGRASDVSEKAEHFAEQVSEKAAGLTETVEEHAGKIGDRTGAIRLQAGGKVEQSPWVAAVAAAVLLLALGISIGRRYFSES